MSEKVKYSMSVLSFALIGYLLGCINGSQIISKFKNVDIGNEGYKNPGASNTTMLLGWKYGAIVAMIDIGKAIIPLIFLKMYFANNPAQIALLYFMGLFIIIGHNYPITMKFKGGKGTASIIGMIFAINWKIGLICLGILLLIGFISDYFVIGVWGMYLSFVGSTGFYYGIFSFQMTIALIIMSLSTVKHIENYRRILENKEIRVSKIIKDKLVL